MFRTSNLVAFGFFAAQFGLVFLLPLFLQETRGPTALESVATFPQPIASLLIMRLFSLFFALRIRDQDASPGLRARAPAGTAERLGVVNLTGEVQLLPSEQLDDVVALASSVPGVREVNLDQVQPRILPFFPL
jgi:hypothetical protein